MGVRASALAADTAILVLTFYEAYRLLRYRGALRASTIMKVMVQQGQSNCRILFPDNLLLSTHTQGLYTFCERHRFCELNYVLS